MSCVVNNWLCNIYGFVHSFTLVLICTLLTSGQIQVTLYSLSCRSVHPPVERFSIQMITRKLQTACLTECTKGALICFLIWRTFRSLKHNNLWIISRVEVKETLWCVGWPFRPPASHFSEKLTALRDSLIRLHLSPHSRGTCFTSFTREQLNKNGCETGKCE